MISRRFSCRLVDQVLELLDLGLERLELGLVPLLSLVELLLQDLAELRLELVPLGVRPGFAELPGQTLGLGDAGLLARSAQMAG